MTMSDRNPPEFSVIMKRKYVNLYVFTLVALVFVFVRLVCNDDGMSIARATFYVPRSTGIAVASAPESGNAPPALPTPSKAEGGQSADTPPVTVEEQEEEDVVIEPVGEGCNLFAGKWVYDDEGHPLYRDEDCGFLTSQVTCVKNGRKDDMYQKWRWQPDGCSLPRFNATRLLRRLRGKRLMFVGDSLHRNQWESMVCLLQSAIPPGRKSLGKNGSLSVFRADDYNATVEFFWAPFLVKSNSDDPKVHTARDRMITVDSISNRGVQWTGADYLIFNTYIWWMNSPNMKILKGSSDNGSATFDEVERSQAYGRVLRTWSDWVDRNVDPARTSVFFSTMSPLHIKSDLWNNPDGIKCAMETQPILNTTTPPSIGTDKRLWAVAADTARTMAVPVTFLNITELSEYRKDAHTSLYTTRQGKLLSPEQRADPATYADCIHWCLPGLPDTWNELLYAKIMSTPVQHD